MTARGMHRGGAMVFVEDDSREDGGDWIYEADGVRVSDDPERPCGFCRSPNRDDGHDPCLGKLPGVVAACCGHGEPETAYVTLDRGCRIAGPAALDLVARIKGIRP